MPGCSKGVGLGITHDTVLTGSFVPTDVSGLELWLRPEELNNPNRLTQTGDLTHADWTDVDIASHVGGQTDPDGGSAASLITANSTASRVIQSATGFQAGNPDTFPCYIKRGPSHNGTSNCALKINDGVGQTTTAFVPQSTWTRHEVTRTLDGSATKAEVRITPDSTTGTEAIYAAFPQLEAGSDSTTYVANAATAGGIVSTWADQSGNSNDVTQGTQAKMPLVQASVLDSRSGALFDGVDDALVNSSFPDNTVDKAALYIVLGSLPNHSRIPIEIGSGAVNTGISFVINLTDIDGRIKDATTTRDADYSHGGFPFGPLLLHMTWDGSGSVQKIYQDGTFKDDAATPAPSLGNVLSKVTIGVANDESTFDFNSHIIEVVYIAAFPSAANQASMLSYFSTRYPTLGI